MLTGPYVRIVVGKDSLSCHAGADKVDTNAEDGRTKATRVTAKHNCRIRETQQTTGQRLNSRLDSFLHVYLSSQHIFTPKN